MERFNHYLRHRFYNPLASRLKQARLVLDKATANLEVHRWLGEVANRRVHGTTKQIPAERLLEEREPLQPLPRPDLGQVLGTTPTLSRPRLAEAVILQPPLSVYEALVQEVSV